MLKKIGRGPIGQSRKKNDWLHYIDNIGEKLSKQNAVCIGESKNVTAQLLSVVLITLYKKKRDEKGKRKAGKNFSIS